MTLKVGIWADQPDFVAAAEDLGVESVWAPEAWGGDAFTPLAYLAGRTTNVRLATGIAQLGARTPAMLAMTAMSMQAISGGRFVLGIGTSGPQVMEGWHGARFSTPVQRTRETIEIIRMVCRGERLAYDGKSYQLPLPGGEGKAIRSMLPPVDVPIHVASLGPANMRMTGELADGWIGTGFVPEAAAEFLAPLREAGRDVELSASVTLEFSDDPDEVIRRHARGYAFTFGAMGSATHNFYVEAFARQGYEDDVREVQRLWLAGDREAAADRVPLSLAERTNLLGTPEMVRARLDAYEAAGVSTLRVGLPAGSTTERLDALARLMALL